MGLVQPTTKISEPVPAIVRPGRPYKSNGHGQGNGQDSLSGTVLQNVVVPPMPQGLPKGVWSGQAERVLRERYLLKNDAGETMETPDQMSWRVAWDIASAESNYGHSYGQILETAKKYYQVLVSHEFLPNSPTLANAGKNNGLQYSACFVLPVDDSLVGIFDAVKWQAVVHQSGGGTGFAFSRLRPSGSIVKSTKGVASGPVSFMRIFDAATEQVKQGGMRRGANMGILRVDHPDILEFIHCKEAGGITNFNISVAATEAFMKAYYEGTDYDLVDPRTKTVVGQLPARQVMEEIADGAWRTGDPGMIFIDRINAGSANPVPSFGPVESTNPCVTGDTLVTTDRGLLPISGLVGKRDVRVLTKEGWQKAARVVETGERTIFLLTTIEGYEIKLTADHKVLTAKGWKEAGKLVSGDKILLSDRKGGFGTEGNVELGRVLGWLVGDGTMKATEAILSFFGEEKQQLAPMFASMVNKLTSGMQKLNRSYPVGVGWLDYRDEARVGSVRLWRLAESYGITPENKLVVPEKVFIGTEETQKGFLQALFTADGHVSGTTEKGVSVRLTSTSKSLLTNVQRLLLNFGVVSQIYSNRRPAMMRSLPDGKGGKKDYFCHEYHDLVIAKNNLWRFAEEIGFLVDYKNIKLIDSLRSYRRGPYKERFEATFAALEEIGQERVYDLVEPVTRSFVAGGLIVHNCGEQPLYPFDVCNLGSIFLGYFVKETDDGVKMIDWERLGEVTKLAVRFLDSVIDRSPFPLSQISETAKAIRRVGLGVGGWADMLAQLGVPYDSDDALGLGEKIMKFINEAGHRASEELAEERGPFPAFSESIYKDGKPLRNATVTTIAPTGTIGIIANASTGIEPFFAIAYKHYVKTNALERSMDFFVPAFERVAEGTSWYDEGVKKKVAEAGTIAHIEEIPEEVRRVFVTAHDISPEWHVRMQAVFQKYTDNAVSKTINLPNSATREDIKKAYLLAYETDCKGITVYRDGSKSVQVLNMGTKGKIQENEIKDKGSEIQERRVEAVNGPSAEVPKVVLEPRPVRVEGATYRIETPLGNAFITVNQDSSGSPFEVFIAIGKAGSEVAAMAEALGRLISTTLRFGNHLPARERAREIIDQLSGIGGGSTVGFGANRVRSLPDAVAKAIAMHFGLNSTAIVNHDRGLETMKDESKTGEIKTVPVHDEIDSAGEAALTMKRDLCPSCGSAALIFEEGCSKCLACGFSKC